MTARGVAGTGAVDATAAGVAVERGTAGQRHDSASAEVMATKCGHLPVHGETGGLKNGCVTLRP